MQTRETQPSAFLSLFIQAGSLRGEKSASLGCADSCVSPGLVDGEQRVLCFWDNQKSMTWLRERKIKGNLCALEKMAGVEWGSPCPVTGAAPCSQQRLCSTHSRITPKIPKFGMDLLNLMHWSCCRITPLQGSGPVSRSAEGDSGFTLLVAMCPPHLGWLQEHSSPVTAALLPQQQIQPLVPLP